MVAVLLFAVAAPASAVNVNVTVENLSCDDGLFLTPVWVGFHGGAFNLYDLGQPASPGLERLAEDGNNGPLGGEFNAADPNGVADVILGPGGMLGDDAGEPPVIDPGETTSKVINVDPILNRYFSFASMVIPSNDAFIGNGDPLAHALFDAGGNPTGPVSILILGADVRDAGTETNTEMDAAFINQAAADAGVPENGNVHTHLGFIDSFANPGGTAIILGGSNGLGANFDATAADFSRPGYELARITLTVVPVPGALGLGLVGFPLVGLVLAWRRRRK